VGAETLGEPYTAIVPASLTPNMAGEIAKWSQPALPHQIMSYTALARGRQPEHPKTLILDEAQRVRNPASLQTQAAIQAAQRAENLYLLSGTPIVNHPHDLAPLMTMLTEREISPQRFDELFLKEEQRSPGLWGSFLGVTPGEETHMKNKGLFHKLLAGHVDYHAPDKPDVEVTEEHHDVPMSPEQTRLYQAFWDQLPWMLRWKLQRQFPLSKDEIRNFASFMAGPRQVSLSTLPFMKGKADPLMAFQQSPKLQAALGKLKQQMAADPEFKAVIYSNFIDAGLTPYAAALAVEGIPHGLFHGGLSAGVRKKAVEDFNHGLSRVLLLGPAGGEGISLRGTKLMQILDPHWNEARSEQAIGRGIRFDSHVHLPPDQRKITVQRFASHLPPGLWQRLFRTFLQKRPDTSRSAPGADYYLQQMSQNKDKLNDEFLEELKRVGQQPPSQPGLMDWLFGKGAHYPVREDEHGAVRPGLHGLFGQHGQSGLDCGDTADALAVKTAGDFAPGLPTKENHGDHTQLQVGQTYDFNRQLHAAHKAGLHEDWRIGNPQLGLLSWVVRAAPAPGERKLAIRQPVHSHSYLGWEGTIPRPNYGAGTVRSKELGKVLVTDVTPHSIAFTTARNRYPERYVLTRPQSVGFKPNEWLLQNVTPTTQLPYTKQHFHSLPHEQAEEFLGNLPEGSSVQPKIDGASSLVVLGKHGIELYSYRTSRVTGRPILHTERFFGHRGPKLNIPRELWGTVLRGELYGVQEPEKSRAASTEETGQDPGSPSAHRTKTGHVAEGVQSADPAAEPNRGGDPSAEEVIGRINPSSALRRRAAVGLFGDAAKTAGIFEQYSTDAAPADTGPHAANEAVRPPAGAAHNPNPADPGGAGKLQQPATGPALQLFLRLGRGSAGAAGRPQAGEDRIVRTHDDPQFAVPGPNPSYSPGGGEQKGETFAGAGPDSHPAPTTSPGMPSYSGGDASGTGLNLGPGHTSGVAESVPDRVPDSGDAPRPFAGDRGAKFGAWFSRFSSVPGSKSGRDKHADGERPAGCHTSQPGDSGGSIQSSGAARDSDSIQPRTHHVDGIRGERHPAGNADDPRAGPASPARSTGRASQSSVDAAGSDIHEQPADNGPVSGFTSRHAARIGGGARGTVTPGIVATDTADPAGGVQPAGMGAGRLDTTKRTESGAAPRNKSVRSHEANNGSYGEAIPLACASGKRADIAGYPPKLGGARPRRTDHQGPVQPSVRVLHPAELGGLLNAGLSKSLARQREQGIQLRNMVFDIEQLGSRPIDFQAVPHAERRRLIAQVLRHLPAERFHLAPEANTHGEIANLWRAIAGGEHPLSHEGVVVHTPLGKPTKIKLRQDSDVHVHSIFPAEGGMAGTHAGGFAYALQPGGQPVGRVGTGFSHEMRRDMLQNPGNYLGRVARIVAQEQLPSGAYRGPAFLALHEDL
jgi:hypothetical protein